MSPEIVKALVNLIEVKDASTAAHTWRVVLYTRALAEAFGVDHDVIARLTTAAALHDVGKLDIPESILQKPGRLTDDEYAVMQTHTLRGHERLVAMGEEDPILLNLVRSHHERFDGLGYPDRLKGDQIPLGPRFFAVIDSFDAMTSVRPYRAQIGEAAALRAIEELEKGKGEKYHPEPVDAFAGLYRSGELDWILHYYNDEFPAPAFEAAAAMQRLERQWHPPPGTNA